MKKLKNVVGWFVGCFGVQKSTDEVIVSEFESKADFLKTMRLIESHGQRARSQSLPNSWVLGNRS